VPECARAGSSVRLLAAGQFGGELEGAVGDLVAGDHARNLTHPLLPFEASDGHPGTVVQGGLGNEEVNIGRGGHLLKMTDQEDLPAFRQRLDALGDTIGDRAADSRIDFIKDEEGNVVEIHCTYDPETKSGTGFTGRKVKGTLHWVEASQAVPAEFRLFEPLLLNEEPEEAEVKDVADVEPNEDASVETEKSFLDHVNPNSLQVMNGFVEPNMKGVEPQEKFQFFRHGYFNVDSKLTTKDQVVFNEIVSLKSSFKL